MAFYLRGALVEFMPTGLIPIPNMIIFQYNPETMTHSWTQPEAPDAGPNQTQTNPLAVKGNPGESFSFTLALDSADSHRRRPRSGRSVRARQRCLHPAGRTRDAAVPGQRDDRRTARHGHRGDRQPVRRVLVQHAAERAGEQDQHGAVRLGAGTDRARSGSPRSRSPSASTTSSSTRPTPRCSCSCACSPTDELSYDTDTLAKVAKAANAYSQGLRQALAVANLGNAADSIVGMLPI